MKLKKILYSIALTCVLVLTNLLPIPVYAEELGEQETGMNVEFASETDLKSQDPVEITGLTRSETLKADSKIGTQVDLSEFKEEDKPVLRNVAGGTVSETLSATGDAKIYSLSLPAGVYLQAQLIQPANAALDYDLYFLDATGNILAYSAYITKINGTEGTIPEALGYITSGDATATYYLYVHSSNGGSISESYTLNYTVSDECDKYETDEHVSSALAFTFGASGAYVDSRNLSSPIDNDWYVVTVPSNRSYDKLRITATTESTNTCSVEVYQNIASSGYEMKKVSASAYNYSVSTGTYYVKVSYAKTMEEYDETDIKNYILNINPVLKADTITITSLNGTEGLNHAVTYPGYGTHFRTGKGTLTIIGYATIKDSSSGAIYGVSGVQVTGKYLNPFWEQNDTPELAVKTGTAITDETGKFEVSIELPEGCGEYTYNASTSYHHFDICKAYAYLSDNTSVQDVEPFFYIVYTVYHG